MRFNKSCPSPELINKKLAFLLNNGFTKIKNTMKIHKVSSFFDTLPLVLRLSSFCATCFFLFIIVLSKNVPILELNVIKLENVYELEMWCCADLRTEEFSRELAKLHFLTGFKPFPVTIVESVSKSRR